MIKTDTPWRKTNMNTKTTPQRAYKDKDGLTKEQRQRIEDLKFAKTHKHNNEV